MNYYCMSHQKKHTHELHEANEAQQRLVVLQAETRSDLVYSRGAHERHNEARRARPLYRHAYRATRSCRRVAALQIMPFLAHDVENVLHRLRV